MTPLILATRHATGIKPCGCGVTLSDGFYFVKRCPLHDSAPDLLAACNDLLDLCEEALEIVRIAPVLGADQLEAKLIKALEGRKS